MCAAREGVNSVIVRVVRTWKRENDQAGNGGRSDDRAGSDVQSDILYKKQVARQEVPQKPESKTKTNGAQRYKEILPCNQL